MYRFEKVVGILIQTGFGENPPSPTSEIDLWRLCTYNVTYANHHLCCTCTCSVLYSNEESGFKIKKETLIQLSILAAYI
jgi:hypothetical protein